MAGTTGREGKEIAALVEAAREQGWRVQERAGGRWRLLSPDGTTTVGGTTRANAPRTLVNLRARLRRAGVEL